METLAQLRRRKESYEYDIGRLTKQLAEVDREITKLERSCVHSWAEPKRHAKRTEGYTIPAINAGSDSRPAMHVPPETKVHWTRTCQKCGKVERTERTRPAPEVPDF